MGVLGFFLDRSVLYAFDRTGFERHARAFRAQDFDVDLRGRVCLVTGANGGLGRATAAALAARGAGVHMLCRNPQRGAEALAEVSETANRDDLQLSRVDLADQGSIREFVAGLEEPTVDVLVHNAGALLDERRLSPDGLEQTWATHVAGPHLLTALLAPRLQRAAQGRVIFVSSGGMYTQRLELEDLQWERRPFDGTVAYAQAKRAQVILAELWAERLADSPVTVNSMHPGWADTEGVRRALPRFWRLLRGRLRTAEQGADTVIWLAVCPALAQTTGLFFFDRRPVSTHKLPWTREREETRGALWRLLDQQCGIADGDDPR